jgi:putative tricarboxylic transport membrane protein
MTDAAFMLDAFVAGFVNVFTWPTFPVMLLGIVVGFAVGILPGIGGAVTLALMLPFTFAMQPVEAFAFLLGMLAVTATTGDITSVLFGVPGESSSAALVLDGHPMTKSGQAGRALGAALMSSLVGAVTGALALAAVIPVVRPIVLSFASPELFGLAILGLTFIGVLSSGSRLKGLLASGFGLMLAMVGLDPVSGTLRYTFGQFELWEGLALVAVTVGLFAIPEVVDLWFKGSSIAEQQVGEIGGVWQGVKDTFINWPLTLRASLLGTVIGIIPGLGGAIAQWVAYGHAVQSSSDKRLFGKGDVRGVLGPGAANNSTLGGSLIPTVAFGVPGNVVMAILLGAFLIQGLSPGPSMLTTNLGLTFAMVWLIVISNVIAVSISFLFLNQLAKITYVRSSLLIPVILLLVYLGSFAATNSTFAMGIALVFGLIGLGMVYLDWPRPPLILGLVLGTLVERNLFISYTRYQFSFLTRPVLVVIIVLCVLVMFGPSLRRWIAGRLGVKEAQLAPEEG